MMIIKSDQNKELELAVSGGFVRIARLCNEYYEFVDKADTLVAQIKQQDQADIFTFVQSASERSPRHQRRCEWDDAAVLQLTTFEQWWKKQINDKTRNMIRKAAKTGVEIREVGFNEDLVRGIERIYNESPVRQGRRFRHFGKTSEIIRVEHSTFLDRSVFIGAYFKDELIGFVKLVHGKGVSNLMNIISLVSHRDKAPTNALLSKSVELCTKQGIPLLHYGSWSRRSMGDFKKHHGFELMRVPRYYVSLSIKGTLALALKLHRPIQERIPENFLDKLAEFRGRWNTLRFGKSGRSRIPTIQRTTATG